MACDARKRVSFPGHDFDTHDLVKCQVLVEAAEVVLEERLADIERRFETHEAHIDEKLNGMELKIGERLTKVDQRLLEMERLLSQLVSALGPRAKPSGASTTYTRSTITQDPYAESYP